MVLISTNNSHFHLLFIVVVQWNVWNFKEDCIIVGGPGPYLYQVLKLITHVNITFVEIN